MKKIVALVLAILLMTTACSKPSNNDQTNKATKDSTIQKDESAETIADEIGKVEFSGITYHLPQKLQDFMNDGWDVLPSTIGYGSEKSAEDYELNSKSSISLTLNKGNDLVFIQVINPSESESIRLVDALVVEMSINTAFSSNVEYRIFADIKLGDPKDKAIKAFDGIKTKDLSTDDLNEILYIGEYFVFAAFYEDDNTIHSLLVSNMAGYGDLMSDYSVQY